MCKSAKFQLLFSLGIAAFILLGAYASTLLDDKGDWLAFTTLWLGISISLGFGGLTRRRKCRRALR